MLPLTVTAVTAAAAAGVTAAAAGVVAATGGGGGGGGGAAHSTFTPVSVVRWLLPTCGMKGVLSGCSFFLVFLSLSFCCPSPSSFSSYLSYSPSFLCPSGISLSLPLPS